MQRVRNHWGIDHILDSYDLSPHGMLVILSMMRCCHLDPSKLLARCAEFMHMPRRGQRIHANKMISIRNLEIKFWSFKKLADLPLTFCARPTCERDQGNIALPRSNRLSSMIDVK